MMNRNRLFDDDDFDDADKKLLIESTIYRDLSEEQLDLVLEACRLEQYAAGQKIVSIGEIGHGLYVVIEGQVKVFLPQKGAEDDDEQPLKISLATLTPGSCFGEYTLLDQKEMSASIEALTPARICYMARTEYRRIVDTNLAVENIIYKNLLTLLVDRLRKMNLELDSVFLA